MAFACSFCQKVFTKKEHLKPFTCQICSRSFSRADVLGRHVKGHKSGAVLQSSPDTNGAPDSHAASGAAGLSHEGTGQQLLDAGTTLWTGAPAGDYLLPSDTSSSLIWPDSENFFQTLTSNHVDAWNQPHASNSCVNRPSVTLENNAYPASNPSPHDETAATEDGRRAVQTTNGLLTETLLNVTSDVALFELTPRFLDSSLHAFFVKFNATFPLVHRPTFIYQECSAPLLLNAIALGSLYLGTEDARVTGECLWRLAHTAIATSWSDMIGNKRTHDSCSGVELVLAALLSQTYAALSKNRTLRMTSQTFYGLSMHWAQYCGMYDVPRDDEPQLPSLEDDVAVKRHAWKSWAARETQLRVLLGLCIVDSVASQFSGNYVNTWAATQFLPLASNERAFGAENEDDWVRAMQTELSFESVGITFSLLCEQILSGGARSIPQARLSGLINLKVILEVLASRASNAEGVEKRPAHSSESRAAIRAVAAIRNVLANTQGTTAADRAIALIRWHAVCLDLVINTAKGARRMCHHYGITQHIFGGSKRQERGQVDPHRWTQGLLARKCLLHAIEIHKIASDIPLGMIHDTCLPGALFAVATTYSSFALPGLTKVFIPEAVDWDMVVSYGLGEVETEWQSVTPSPTLTFLSQSGTNSASGWTARNLLYELGSIRILLHSISQHWGVTQEMEEVISSWEARCH
ncbi:hypothetical protein CKM354_001157600 [Cercospora kikuchii]|uniref:C2H2-type domain-containing protein n=1 Tax=Cercospora kikuchii TaxID=84275 RepID=A0A9P3CSI7_9PEZI|nr:uncharacterized protein CKM354_001157600 [Cercospora kikuchii]GIZ48522.1 hypothetical protein CKM354_001157600 [Cercospora kikuchii]